MADETPCNDAPADVPVDVEDAAWASINIPLDRQKLMEFCKVDIERLFRINPMYEFETWQPAENGAIHFTAMNLSNSQTIDTDLQIEAMENGMRINYSSGLKASTEFRFEDAPQGSRLILIEDYGELDEATRQQRIDEVDKSLVPWANYLQEYLVKWKRWSWLPPWRWYMRRVWQPMTPSARRITYMILWITFAEIVAFLSIFMVFWLEMDKYFGDL